MATIGDDIPSGSDITMAEGGKRKMERMLTDAKGAPNQKKARIVPDVNVKKQAIYLLIHWHCTLMKLFGLAVDFSVDDVCEITSIIYTLHTKLRQEKNQKGAIHAMVTDDFKFTCNKKEAKYSDIKPKMVATAKIYGFEYTKDHEKMLGTLGSILAVFVAFKSRYNEVRSRTTHMILEKKNNIIKECNISEYGLSNRHAPTTSGITFNPSLQSSMRRSLGPMTVAIILAKTKDQSFSKAWKATFVEMFRLLPQVEEIATEIAGAGTSANVIMGQLADLALTGVARPANKATFPFAFVIRNCMALEAFCNLNLPENPTTMLTDSSVPPAIFALDFSGVGAYKFWHASTLLTHKGKPVGDSIMTSQVLFHAVWGTAKEDLSLLAWMTDVPKWHTRREIGKGFEGRGDKEPIQLTLPKFKYVAKLSNSSTTNFISGGTGQDARMPIFNGKCNQRVNLDGSFFKSLITESSEKYVSRTSTKDTIIQNLNSVKSKVANQIRKDGRIDFGFVDFCQFKSSMMDFKTDPASVPTLDGIYFFNQEDKSMFT